MALLAGADLAKAALGLVEGMLANRNASTLITDTRDQDLLARAAVAIALAVAAEVEKQEAAAAAAAAQQPAA